MNDLYRGFHEGSVVLDRPPFGVFNREMGDPGEDGGEATAFFPERGEAVPRGLVLLAIVFI